MKTSGLFTTHAAKIPVSFSKPVRLVFFGDVHRDSPDHADGKWQEFIRYARGLKDTWFVGMGDYLDSTSTSEREMLGNISPRMHDTFRKDIQALQLAKIEKLASELEFMKGRLVGLLNGNHYFEFQSGINGDQKLAELLNTKYLGVCAFVRLTFHNGGRKFTRDLFAHHGAGAARLIGGSMNRVQQMAEGAEADIYAMGHDHKRGALPAQPRIFLAKQDRFGGLRVEYREPILIRSGSFLASFKDGCSSYNVDACRPPSSLGHVELLVTVRERGAIEMRSLV